MTVAYVPEQITQCMKTYQNLFKELCSYENLELAFKKARKRKTLKEYVIRFETDLEDNLKRLKNELETHTYLPEALTTFIVRDPKTRKISAPVFRDRVMHHALCNVIQPVFERSFIYDSFANQKFKGTHLAIKRLESFIKKVSVKNNPRLGFALKCDIRHYFDSIDRGILLDMIHRKIKDENVIWLIKTILENHRTNVLGKGMPLGNMTSQFFANVYLNDLDYFIKHSLKIKYYIRYVDDFVILGRTKELLSEQKDKIDEFLRGRLKLELHPEKSRIIEIRNGITFLGFRVFPTHRLLKKSNARRIWKRLDILKQHYDSGSVEILY